MNLLVQVWDNRNNIFVIAFHKLSLIHFVLCPTHPMINILKLVNSQGMTCYNMHINSWVLCHMLWVDVCFRQKKKRKKKEKKREKKKGIFFCVPRGHACMQVTHTHNTDKYTHTNTHKAKQKIWQTKICLCNSTIVFLCILESSFVNLISIG